MNAAVTVAQKPKANSAVLFAPQRHSSRNVPTGSPDHHLPHTESTRSSTCFWVLRRTTHYTHTHTHHIQLSWFFYALICQAAYKIHPLQTKVFGLRLKVHPPHAKKTLTNSCMVHRQILQLATEPNWALSSVLSIYHLKPKAFCNIWLFTSPFVRIYAHTCANYKPSMGLCS